MIELRAANSSDLSIIRNILVEADLVLEGVEENIRDFIVLSKGLDIIGCIGLEVFDTFALLRSFAVRPPQQRQGYGLLLLKEIEKYAENQGIEQLFLLTDTAEGFFEKNGYALYDRNAAPSAIAVTREFSEFCPSSSSFMKKDIGTKKSE